MTCLRVPHLESRTPRRRETILCLASSIHGRLSTFPYRFSLATAGFTLYLGDLRPNPIFIYIHLYHSSTSIASILLAPSLPSSSLLLFPVVLLSVLSVSLILYTSKYLTQSY